MTLIFILTAIILTAISGLPGFFLSKRSARGQITAAFLVCLGSFSGLAGVVFAFTGKFTGRGSDFVLFTWLADYDAFFRVDALSAFFLVPIFTIAGLGALFGLGYWPQKRRPRTALKVQFFWGILTAGMTLLVISKHAMVFFFGWEFMAISAFFLITAEDDKPACRKSGLVYLAATHLGSLILLGLFAFWRSTTGSFNFVPLEDGTATLLEMNILFFLTIIGFGLKAGIMPLHFWLPGAHSNAPSHVSGMLSGVMLKMGIYGIVRMLSLLPNPPVFWGWIILFLGAGSGLLGVVFAIAQHDLKRLLAYHSVENIGIILMGLGLAMLGRSYNHPDWVVLGMAGCLLHVWNHSFFKSLLFFGAGSILLGTHTRQIDQLGGLAKKMPWTAAMFLIGAVAISGLPPLNGFISEFFIYLGLSRTVYSSGYLNSMALLAIPVLAMIGALAVACFVKVYGAIFLGSPRTKSAEQAHESSRLLLLPMLVLSVLCIIIGLFPGLVVPVLEQTISVWLSPETITPLTIHIGTFVPLPTLSTLAIVLSLAIGLSSLFFGIKYASNKRAGTWDCGYARPTARMQYTASSFAQSLVKLFSWVLKPDTHKPDITLIFPVTGTMESEVDELVLDRTLIPVFQGMKKIFKWFRRFQQGQTQAYIFYLLVVLVIMLVFLFIPMVFSWLR